MVARLAPADARTPFTSGCYAAGMSCRPGIRRLAAVALAVLALTPRPRAVEANLTAQAVDDAITFARMAQRGARQEFHDRYVRSVSETVRRISIVSEVSGCVVLRKRLLCVQ